MGTNYYTANEGEFNRHIGKSSSGWRFLVDADGMRTWDWSEVKRQLSDAVVIDEYGDRVTSARLVEFAEAQADGRSHVTDVEWLDWMTPRETKADGPVDFTEGGFS